MGSPVRARRRPLVKGPANQGLFFWRGGGAMSADVPVFMFRGHFVAKTPSYDDLRGPASLPGMPVPGGCSNAPGPGTEGMLRCRTIVPDARDRVSNPAK